VQDGEFQHQEYPIIEDERPPMIEIPEYRKKFKLDK